jgi:signal transduction histidine kinase
MKIEITGDLIKRIADLSVSLNMKPEDMLDYALRNYFENSIIRDLSDNIEVKNKPDFKNNSRYEYYKIIIDQQVFINELFAFQSRLNEPGNVFDEAESINNFMKFVSTFFKHEHIFFLEYDVEREILQTKYEWNNIPRDDNKNLSSELTLKSAEWYKKQIIDNKLIVLNSLNDLPENAKTEREVLHTANIKSVLCIPVFCRNKKFRYRMGIITYSTHTYWKENDAKRLTFIGVLLAGTLENKYIRDELNEYKQKYNELIEKAEWGNSELLKNETALNESNFRLEKSINELKETQKMMMQNERMRSLGLMASGIAHDINNVLSPIVGYSDLILKDPSAGELTKKRASYINMAGWDIMKTIKGMREFYRPYSNEDDFKMVDLNSTVINTINLTRHRWKDMAESNGAVIEVSTVFQHELPKIYGDASQIREALTNLIINAADAMPNGGKLNLKTGSIDNNILIEVSDTGSGMDKDTLRNCLDPFYTTKGEKGSGLGLSMVYGIMQRHKGKIEIDSQIEKGTTIKLLFPLYNLADKPEIEIQDKPVNKMKVLCIDDNKDVGEIITAILRDKNHRVDFVDNGRHGLNLFYNSLDEGEPYDIVITDLSMPYMDGKTVAEKIKTQSPGTPVIMMTGWEDGLDANPIKNIDYYLKKPISINDLEKGLQSVQEKFKKERII